MPEINSLIHALIEKVSDWLKHLVALLPNMLVALIILVLGFVASRLLGRIVRDVLMRTTKNAPISQLLGTVARVALLLVAVFFALGLLELDKTVTSLLAGVGVVGLALGFAFQDIAANFMSGFIMVLSRPFDVGDLVELSGHRGRVKSIALRATSIETLQGLSILIPNKEVFQNPIINYTTTQYRRLDMTIGTAYGDDMAKVREVVIGAVQAVPGRDNARNAELFFEQFADSSINFQVRIWLERSDEPSYLHARSEALIAIKSALDAAGFSIPFPIRTLDFGAQVVGGVGLSQTPLRRERADAEAAVALSVMVWRSFEMFDGGAGVASSAFGSHRG